MYLSRRIKYTSRYNAVLPPRFTYIKNSSFTASIWFFVTCLAKTSVHFSLADRNRDAFILQISEAPTYYIYYIKEIIYF